MLVCSVSITVVMILDDCVLWTGKIKVSQTVIPVSLGVLDMPPGGKSDDFGIVCQ